MNYDFLTVEDYNTIVLNYADGFKEDYLLSFSDLNGLTEGFYIIDGFIKVTVNNIGVFLEILNTCFTGSFCLINANNSGYNILDYDVDKHSLTLKLNIDDADTVNGGLLLHLTNGNIPFSVNTDYYIVAGATIRSFYNTPAVFNLLIKNSDSELYNGSVTIGNTQYTVVDGVLKYTLNVSEQDIYNILTIGDFKTILSVKTVKQNIVYNIDYDSSTLYQGVRNGKLIINTIAGVTGVLKYNNKAVTATSNNNGVLTFNLDLSNHLSDNLDCNLELSKTNCNGFIGDLSLETHVLSGTFAELNTIYKPLKPTLYYVTGGDTAYIYLDYSIKLIYPENKSINTWLWLNAPNITVELENYNVTTSNLDFIVILKKNITLILNNSKINVINYGFINMSDLGAVYEGVKYVINNSEFILNRNTEAFVTPCDVVFNNCIFNRIGTYTLGNINYAFGIIKDNGNVTFNNCMFNAEFTVTANKNGSTFFEISENATVNGKTGKELKNNDVFPFTNNKSNVDIIDRGNRKHITGVNGITWTVTGTGKVYNQNCKIEAI